MEAINLPIGALVEHGNRLMRHVGGGSFVPHTPGPEDAIPDGLPLAKRFSRENEGPILGGGRAPA